MTHPKLVSPEGTEIGCPKDLTTTLLKDLVFVVSSFYHPFGTDQSPSYVFNLWRGEDEKRSEDVGSPHLS